MSKDFGEVWGSSWDKGCSFILPGDNPNYQLKLSSTNQNVHSQFMAALQAILAILNQIYIQIQLILHLKLEIRFRCSSTLQISCPQAVYCHLLWQVGTSVSIKRVLVVMFSLIVFLMGIYCRLQCSLNSGIFMAVRVT